jgi:catechol 1,2-dioxygenase
MSAQKAALATATEAPASGIIDDEASVTPVVVAAMSKTPDARLREIMEAFVRHAHAFAREVNITEEEFQYGTEFLNRIGKATNDKHNEAILFSDTIGFSTLICLLNNGQNSKGGTKETAAALLGPFWRMNSPLTANGGNLVRSTTPGPIIFADVRVLDPHGKPIEGVEVDVWHSSPVGMYENQDPNQADMNLRGKFFTDADGRFFYRSTKPGPYPVPVDGPVGDMLRAQLRHCYRPAHFHFLAFKEGFKTLVTQVFVADDQYLHSDVVFGVTTALVGDYRRHPASEKPPADDVTGDWYSFNYDLIMEPGDAKLPIPPIK